MVVKEIFKLPSANLPNVTLISVFPKDHSEHINLKGRLLFQCYNTGNPLQFFETIIEKKKLKKKLSNPKIKPITQITYT